MAITKEDPSCEKAKIDVEEAFSFEGRMKKKRNRKSLKAHTPNNLDRFIFKLEICSKYEIPVNISRNLRRSQSLCGFNKD